MLSRKWRHSAKALSVTGLWQQGENGTCELQFFLNFSIHVDGLRANARNSIRFNILSIIMDFVRILGDLLIIYKSICQAPLNTIVLNPELNEIKRFGNDGFTIVPKIKDEKDFSFMIQKGKLKVDDIIEKREEWVAVSAQSSSEVLSQYTLNNCSSKFEGPD